MKVILILVMWGSAGFTSQQIEFSELESCQAAIDQLPSRWDSKFVWTGHCIEVPE